MTKRNNQTKHDSMVKFVADHISTQGLIAVKADIQGYEQPDLIFWEATQKGHIPDVSGIFKTQLYIFEVETDDSIDDAHTADQWSLFSAYAKQFGKKFIVVVPKESEQKARQRVSALKIAVDNVWIVS